jgi:hypothetical protein
VSLEEIKCPHCKKELKEEHLINIFRLLEAFRIIRIIKES